MKALWVLARLRVFEVVRVPATGVIFLAMPLLLFCLAAVIFANGHPFERRRLAVIGAVEGLESLASYPELQLDRENSRAAAVGKLKAHLVNGVLEPQAGGGWRLQVGERDQVLGLALKGLLPALQVEVLASPRWGFVHYVFPGVLAFTVIMGGLFGLGYTMVRYRQNLFLRKLSTTPIAKTTFIAAQILGRGILVSMQTLLLLACAHLLFGLPLSPGGAAWTVALSGLGLLAFLGLGFALACLIRNEGLIYDAITLVGWPVVLLSEMFFPADQLPGPLPGLAAVLPSTQLVRLLRSVLLYGETSVGALGPGLCILACWAAAAFTLGRLLFRWGDE